MQFCIISPAKGLNRYSTLSRAHLILPQVELPEYIKFYQALGEAGDFLILDNGAYEGDNRMDKVLEMIPIYRPSIIVLPDFKLQPWRKTYDAARKFLDLHFDQFLGGRWMYVPQSTKGEVTAWVEGCIRALDDPRITAIGLPRVLPTVISLDPLIRANTASWIKKTRPDIYVHALGMAAGNIAELEFLSRAGCDSIDSSAPVWRGWNGVDLVQTANQTPVGDVDFAAPWHDSVERDLLILHNLEACGVDTSSIRTVSRSPEQEVAGGKDRRAGRFTV